MQLQKQSDSTLYFGVFLILWWSIAFVITHMPVSENIASTPYIDKITHIILYTVLAFLFSLWKKSPYIPYIILILAIYAIFDEVSQGFVERTPDIQDFLIDVVGICIGSLIFMLVSKK